MYIHFKTTFFECSLTIHFSSLRY